MADSVEGFGSSAKALARNPLGIIALFIVLVYGLASLVTLFASSFTPAERTPLIYFLVGFPTLVLAVFGWLVSCHSGKLFAPSDFKDEQNYVKMQMDVVASLTAASTKSDLASPKELERIVEAAQAIRSNAPLDQRLESNHVLWVDDRPSNNKFERQAFEAVGIRFTLAETTNEALAIISRKEFAAIISDMGRREGPREGYLLLDQLRKQGNQTPLFFYASSNEPEHKRETLEHGGQGCTNNAKELFEMVTRAIIVGRRT